MIACPLPHRRPEGPNEDLAVCPQCWGPTFGMRPEGETYGWHLDDCSLPMTAVLRLAVVAAVLAVLWPLITVLRVWDDLCIRYDAKELDRW